MPMMRDDALFAGRPGATGPLARVAALAARACETLFRLALLAPALLLAALLLGLLLSPARAETAAATSCSGRNLLPDLQRAGKLAAMETAAAKIPNGKGKFYRVEKEGLPASHLFGTMHMSDPRILAVGEAVDGALQASTRLVVETTDILEEAKTAALIFTRPDLLNLPDGQTLADVMTPEQLARASEKLGAEGIPLQSIERMQPWFFSTGLMFPPCEATRMAAGEKPLDLRLALDAKAEGKEVLGLETGEEQLEALASLGMDIQVESLLAMLELKDQLPDVFETMLELYVTGDIAMITPLSEAVMPLGAVSAESARGYAEFEERIVTKRNLTMATRLEPILASGGTFVAVGALHLPGEQGLVELLRAQGFTVTRLD